MANPDVSESHDHDSCGHDHDHGAGLSGGESAEGRADLSGAGCCPILIEVTRGGIVESCHRGSAVIVESSGRMVARWGDSERPVFPRSAIKSLQAIPLVETGALDACNLGEPELALACASHTGETRHTRLIAAWLHKIGLTVANYECGAHLPHDEETAAEMIRAGQPPTALHNNCSGKHAGMLTTALHRRESLTGYVHPDHPVQRRILRVLEEMTGCDLSAAPIGIDGCSIPTIAIPLAGIALAMARIADPRGLPEGRAHAATLIRRAWGAHGYLIGGRTSFDTQIMHAAPSGLVLVKTGAEGVMCAALPKLGYGIAVKIDDGAGRAATVALTALLRHLRVLPEERWAELTSLTAPSLLSRTGREVGVVRTATDWPQ